MNNQGAGIKEIKSEVLRERVGHLIEKVTVCNDSVNNIINKIFCIPDEQTGQNMSNNGDIESMVEYVFYELNYLCEKLEYLNKKL